MMRRTALSCFMISLMSCAQPAIDGEFGGNSSTAPQVTANPFSEGELGDDYAWGEFIREPYQTVHVTSLPLPVYTAYFNPDEIDVIQEAIDLANEAVGYDVFELTDTWSSDARIIYKVRKISFEEDGYEEEEFDNVVGYTFSRNVYMHGLKEAGRIVTDWAMEIRADHVNKWVIAHELGHAMGIQKHAMINYEEDSLEDLPHDALMAETISVHPDVEDYNFMMRRQGELLLEYIDTITH